MKYFALTEIKKIVSNGSYRHVGLFLPSGEAVINYNGLVKERDKKWEEISKRLSSKGLKDGIYIIKSKSVTRKESIPDEFYFNKGDVKTPEISEDKTPALNDAPHVLSWEEALRLNTENTRLRLENENLQSKIKDMETQLSEEPEEEEEEEPEEEKTPLQDGATSLLTGLVPALIPMADKYFAQNDRLIKIKEIQAEIDLLKVKGSPAPGVSPENSGGEEIPKKIPIPDPESDPQGYMKYLAWLSENDPKKYESIISTLK